MSGRGSRNWLTVVGVLFIVFSVAVAVAPSSAAGQTTASADLTFSVQDEDGTYIENAKVVLYEVQSDGSWATVAEKRTDSSGFVDFTGYASGDYRYEVYSDGEFWGGGAVSLQSGYNYEDFDRLEPYEESVSISSGPHYVDETIDIDPQVRNPSSVDKDVRVKILVDTDNDGVEEITKTRGPKRIASGGSGWYGYDFSPSTSGTKQVRVIVELKFGSGSDVRWVETDDTGWSSTISVNSNTGDLTVNVDDRYGYGVDDANVVLYEVQSDGTWKEINEKTTGWDDQAEWTDLDPDTYQYEVYGDNGAFWGGGSVDVTRGSTAFEDFSRHEPYESGSDYSDNGDGDGTLIEGESVELSADVTNDVSAGRDVRVTFDIDTDDDGNSERSLSTTEYVSSGNEETVSETYTPSSTGTDSFRVTVESAFGSDWVTTSKTGWIENYDIEADAGSVTVTARNENGNAVSGADVVLYDDNYNEIGEKSTGSDGSVTWSGLDTERYNIEVYGSSGAFWNGGSASVQAQETTTVSIERSEPYHTGTTYTDVEGNGKHVVGEQVTISPTIYNDLSTGRNVKVNILVDVDNDGTAEEERTRGVLFIDSHESRSFGYDHTIESDTPTKVRIVTKSEFTIDGQSEWVKTGDTGWMNAFDPISDEGDLSVSVTDESGNLEGGATVVLYDDQWNELEKVETDSNGVATWSSLATGTYHFEVYDNRGSFWGGGTTSVSAGESTTATLERTEPYEQATLLTDVEGNGKHIVGDTIAIGPKIYNDGSAGRPVRVKILVDTDNDDTAEVTKLRGPLTIDSKSVESYGYRHEVGSSGTKQVRVIVESKFTVDDQDEWVQTDDTGWAKTFQGYRDEGSVEISVTDEDGRTATDASVVLYNETWEEIGEKTTGSDGVARWSGLQTEVHHVEVYGPDGSFWGGTNGTVNATETTALSVSRVEPYHTETVVADKNENGKNVVGEIVTISPKVTNDVGFGRYVKVRIQVDTDNDGTAEVEKLRGPVLVSDGEIESYGYEHTISSAGTKQVRTIVETNFTVDGETDWVQTDDTGWSTSFSTIKNEGSISASASSAGGTSSPNAEIVLYDDDWDEIEKKELGDDGTASWSGLPTATYHIEAYGPKGSFWGGKTVDVLAGETTTTSIAQDEPYHRRTVFEDATNNDGIFQVDDRVLISPVIKNDAPANRSVRVKIRVDTDNDGEAEVTELRGPIEIGSGESGGFGYEHLLGSTGTKQVSVIVETKFTVEGSEEWVQTDASGWVSSFEARRSDAGIQTTIKNRDGQRITGATVVLYDESWNVIESRQTNLNGQVEWAGLESGTYHLEAYGPQGAFWGGQVIETQSGFVNTTTIQQKEPYARATTTVDTTNGDGIFVDGETFTLRSSVTTDTADKPVRVTYGIDTDADGTVEETIRSSSEVVSSSSTTTFEASYTPTSTGTKQVETIVETQYTVDGETKWVVTDRNQWSVTPEVVSEATDLKVTVEKADGTTAGDVTVVIYDSNYERVKTLSAENGVAFVDDIADGDYIVEAYGEAGYWNAAPVTVGSGSTTLTVHRKEPRPTSTAIRDDDGTFTTNETIQVTAQALNDQNFSRSVRLAVQMDTDADGAAEKIIGSSSARTLSSTSATDIQTTISFDQGGKYWIRPVIQTTIDGEWVTTGGDSWRSIGIAGDGENQSLTTRITQKPEDVPSGESTLFRADVTAGSGTTVTTHIWEFGDGETATGTEVAHAYEEAGTYTVTHIAVTESGERHRTYHTVEVQRPNKTDFEIESVDPHVRGEETSDLAVIEGTAVDVTYRADMTMPDETASVTFKLGNQTYTDTNGKDGWSFQFDAETLDESETLVVEATSTTGETTRKATQVSVVQAPAWFDSFQLQNYVADEGVMVFKTQLPDGGVSSSTTVPNEFPFGDNVTMPAVGQEQSNTVEVYLILRVDLATTETDVTLEGAVTYELAVITVNGEVRGTAYLDLAEGDFRNGTMSARATATAEYPPAPTGIPSPPVGPVPPGVVSVYPIFTAEMETTARFDERDSPGKGVQIEYTGGTVSPRLQASQEIGKKWAVFEFVLGLREGIDTVMPLEDPSAVSGTVYGKTYARAKAYGFYATVSYPRGDERFEYTFENVSTGIQTTAVDEPIRANTGDETEWAKVSKTGPAPPKPNARTGGFGGYISPMESGYQPTRIVDTGTVTNNTVADVSPAMTEYGQGQAVVWSHQDVEKSVLNGRDIYISQSAEGSTDFNVPEAVTDDNHADYDPDIAGTGDGNAMVVFTRFSKTFNDSGATEPADMYPYAEIEFVTHDGSGWSNATAVTNDGEFDYNPVVVEQDGVFLLAWIHDSDNDLSTWQDRSVKYVRIDGEMGPVKTIDTARAPRVSVGQDGSFKLAYLEMEENTTNGAVTVRTIDPATGDTTETGSHAVSHLTDIDSVGDDVAWVDAATPDAPLRVLTDGGVNAVPLPAEASVPQAIHLTARGDRLLVSFRSHTPGSDVAKVFYKGRVDGEWLPAHKYADGTAANLTFWQGDSVATDTGFVSVFAGKELATDQQHDLYAFDQKFRPDLGVSTRVVTANASVGESATVNYTVTNTGDVPADNVTIELRNESGVVRSRTVPTLPTGANTTGSFSSVVDASGRVTVVADTESSLSEFNESDNQATSIVVKPDLTVTSITAERANGTMTIRAPISNPSPVRATNVTYRVSNGETVIGTGETPSLAPGETETVTVEVSTKEYDPSYSTTVTVDPNEQLAEADESNNSVSRKLLQPEMGLDAGQINYYRDNGMVVASILVGNDGLGPGNATLRVRNYTESTVVAEKAVKISPSDATNTTAYTRVTMSLGETQMNESLQFEISDPNETRPADNVAVDSVDLNATLIPPSGSISANSSVTQVGEPVRLEATNLTDVDGQVDQLYWVLPNSTRVMNETSLTWEPSSAGDRTVELVVIDDDGLLTRTDQRIRIYDGPAPVVSGMSPPTDPDDDGTYEDVNGDGTVNIVDVQAMYVGSDSASVEASPRAFDFNGDGEVNIIDVQALYVMTQSDSEDEGGSSQSGD